MSKLKLLIISLLAVSISVIFLLITSPPRSTLSQEFVHPLDFDPKTDKDKVIAYIEKQINEAVGSLASSSNTRGLEEMHLRAFKKLTEAENSFVLNEAIKNKCATPATCNYRFIEKAYLKLLRDIESLPKEKLTWD